LAVRLWYTRLRETIRDYILRLVSGVDTLT
jgi:hypothetical protein